MIKKRIMPGEFVPKANECIADGKREILEIYYSIGGYRCPFAKFKGRIAFMTEEEGILFKQIHVELQESGELNICTIEGVEEQFWVYDTEPFLKADVKEGDYVSFSAIVYAYKREDGTSDFSLKECNDVHTIPEFEIPEKEVLKMRNAISFAEHAVCDACIYAEQCYREPCLAAPGYKENQARILLRIMNPELEEKILGAN